MAQATQKKPHTKEEPEESMSQTAEQVAETSASATADLGSGPAPVLGAEAAGMLIDDFSGVTAGM